MTLSQQTLHREAVRRIRRSRPDLAARRDLGTAAGLMAAAPDAVSTETVAICVANRLELASWVAGSCAFALGLDPGQRSAWRRSFTRTVFLAGNPANLADRVPFGHVTADRSAGWAGPDHPDAFTSLRRLLKLFDAPDELPTQPARRIEVPAGRGQPRVRAPVRRDLYLATAGVSTTDCMVNLNHLLAEAVLDGLVGPADILVLRCLPRLAGVTRPFAALRVGVDGGNHDRLRGYAGLTEEVGAGD